MFLNKNKRIDNTTDEVAFLIYSSKELYNRRKADKFIPYQVTSFFNFIKKRWSDYEKEIADIKIKAKLTRDQIQIDTYLRKLDVIKEVLFITNYFLKDILDISIEDTPSPFLIVLNTIVREYNPSYGVIAVKCPVYNYQFIPLYDILMGSIISDISMIAYPFTESHAIFNNIVLAHEVGHFIYRKFDLRALITTDLGSSFDSFEERISLIAKKRSEKEPLFSEVIESQIWNYIWLWSEELAADYFAIKNVGVAYFLAFLRVHYVTPLSSTMNSFTETHPSSNYRIRRMVGLLIETGWETILRDKCPDIYEWLQHNAFLTQLSTEIAGSDHNFDEDILSQAYEFFDKISPSVYKVITNVTRAHEYKADTLTNYLSDILQYLSELLPPYQSPLKKGLNYDPISIINAAYIFLLNQGIETLLSNSDRNDTVEDKYYFYKKLNGLVLKGIEDYLIVEEWN